MGTERLIKKETTETRVAGILFDDVHTRRKPCPIWGFQGTDGSFRAWSVFLRTSFHDLRGASDAALEQACIGRQAERRRNREREGVGDPDVSSGIKKPNL